MKSLILTFFLIGLPLFAGAQKELDSYLAQAKTIETFQADFTQEKYLSVLSSKESSSGWIRFQKSGPKLIWALEKPYAYRFILNEKKIIKDYPQLGEREELELEQQPHLKAIFDNIFILMGLKGSSEIYAIYQVSLKKKQIILIPKNPEFRKYISRIEMTLKTGVILESLKLFEPSGDYTLIRFSNPRLNLPLQDAGSGK